jgi:uncharacterized membrane protein YraQ (UPF0718 family)
MEMAGMTCTLEIAQAARRTAATFARTIPVILGVLALASLLMAAVSPERIVQLLPMQSAVGPLFAAIVGSVAAGSPVTSYVFAGELMSAGASLATVTALIVSWVTVGIVQLPAEAAILGMRFALWRNAISFGLALAMAYLVAALLSMLC